MTRGTLFYYEDDDNIWSSTEFNGDMYHGTPEEPQGNGDKVIKLMTGLKSLDDFRNVLKEINKDYGYDEGNDCWSVSDEAIAEDNKKAIEWIEKDRPDLKGDKDFDPRAMERVPTFKDVRTWKFWGTPNLSDFSYIYNNSGKDLLIITKSQTPGMIIPDGAVGVLNYGSNDSIFKDGKLVDGMGNYKETPELPAKTIWNVLVSSRVSFQTEVEAETEEEAKKLAMEQWKDCDQSEMEFWDTAVDDVYKED